MPGEQNIKIKQLIIIAGVSGTGKSTFIDKVIEGRLDKKIMLDLFGTGRLEKAMAINAYDIEKTSLDNVDTLLLHYDIHSNYFPDEGFIYLRSLFSHATQIKVITFCLVPHLLIPRMQNRLKKAYKELMKRPSWKKIRRIRFIRSKIRFYNDTSALIAFYDAWNAFLTDYQHADHNVCNSDPNQELHAQPYNSTFISGILLE